MNLKTRNMEHIINITENKEKGFFQILHNGGVAFIFDSEIFSLDQMVRFAYKTYKTYKTLEVGSDTVKVIHSVDYGVKCPHCGSHKVRSIYNGSLCHYSKDDCETEGYLIDNQIYITLICDGCEELISVVSDIVLRPIKK